MTFYEDLTDATADDRAALVGTPLIARALAGQISREVYVEFLIQAWHHVRHTVPLLMAVGAHLPEGHRWLLDGVAHYIDDEIGHDRWILSDIEHAGGDPVAASRSTPAPATDAMVGYAYDVATRRNPVGFFGMVFVLEGTSVALACRVADVLQRSLALPSKAMTYLRSHGELDRDHVEHLAGVLNRLDSSEDQHAVLANARTFYWLYASVFSAIDASMPAPGERKRA
jgi:pyrroloquinoline quinone (PQQ) biosynthesis protein C